MINLEVKPLYENNFDYKYVYFELYGKTYKVRRGLTCVAIDECGWAYAFYGVQPKDMARRRDKRRLSGYWRANKGYERKICEIDIDNIPDFDWTKTLMAARLVQKTLPPELINL